MSLIRTEPQVHYFTGKPVYKDGDGDIRNNIIGGFLYKNEYYFYRVEITEWKKDIVSNLTFIFWEEGLKKVVLFRGRNN
ncbi:MAG: hypothetical protein ACOCRK_08135 [bacterium]